MNKLLLIATWLATAMLPTSIYAGSFSINPIRIDLSATTPTALLQVRNTGGAPVTIQVSALSWSQSGGEDRMERSRDLLATPAIFTLAPGATQAVRVGALRKPDPSVELTYRLLLQEIPSIDQPAFNGLQVALNVSVPVFIVAMLPAEPRVEASLSRESAHESKLRLYNRGGATAHFLDLSLFSKNAPEKVLATHAATVYVLPGQSRELRFKTLLSESDRPLGLKAVTRSGSIEFDVQPTSQ